MVIFNSPSGTLSESRNIGLPSEPNILEYDYEGIITLPQFTEVGIWTVAIEIFDQVGNDRHYDSNDLELLGFPVELEVVSFTEDTTPPELVEFDFTPKIVDISSGSQSVTFTAKVTDDLSGTKEQWLFSIVLREH